MSINRVHRKTNAFSQILNEAAHSKDLGWAAKGILWYLLTKPNGWEVRTRDLMNQSADGERIVKSGLKNLEEKGYLVRWCDRTAKGRLEWKSEIFESLEDAKEWAESNSGLLDNAVRLSTGTATAIGVTKKDGESPCIQKPCMVTPCDGEPCDGKRPVIVITERTITDLEITEINSSDQDCGKASIKSESEPDLAQKEALSKKDCESDQVNEDFEKKPVHKGRRRSKETPKHEPEAFEIWWKKYYAFCLSIDHESGSRKETVPSWDDLVAEGCLDEIIEGTDWYILCKTKSYASKDRTALAVPHGIRYLHNRKWKAALDHKRLKSSTIAHSAETESKPPAPTQSELLAEAQKFIDLGWIEISYTNNIYLDLYPESKRLIAKTAWGRWIPQERWGTMLEDLARDLKKERANSVQDSSAKNSH